MSIFLRAALPQDAEEMAKLVDIAGEGLPCAIWGEFAAPNQSALEAGTALIRRDRGSFTWRRGLIAECDDHIAGLIISHDTGREPEEITETTHPALRPLIKLENSAPRTRCISVLATFPQYRRSGIARALMEEVETNPGAEGMSLVTGDGNSKANAFYEALGYIEAGDAPMIQGRHSSKSTRWRMMRKPISRRQEG